MPGLQAHPWPTPEGGSADPRPPAARVGGAAGGVARGPGIRGLGLPLCHNWDDHRHEDLLRARGFHALKVV